MIIDSSLKVIFKEKYGKIIPVTMTSSASLASLTDLLFRAGESKDTKTEEKNEREEKKTEKTVEFSTYYFKFHRAWFSWIENPANQSWFSDKKVPDTIVFKSKSREDATKYILEVFKNHKVRWTYGRGWKDIDLVDLDAEMRDTSIDPVFSMSSFPHSDSSKTVSFFDSFFSSI